MPAEITLQQGSITQNVSLAHRPLHIRDFIRKSATAVGDLRRLIYRLPALVRQPVNGKSAIDERNDQWQADQSKAQQNEFDKGFGLTPQPYPRTACAILSSGLPGGNHFSSLVPGRNRSNFICTCLILILPLRLGKSH